MTNDERGATVPSSFSLHPAVEGWFQGAFPAGFTEAQRLCLPHILAGCSVLLLSPTGSGKTLAGFLGVIDALLRERDAAPGGQRFGAGIRALYVSPLRALTYDIQKNLERPLRDMGLLAPADDPKADGIRLGLRTGDTDARERARLRRRPPHLLLTTPESLAILLAQPAWHPALAACRFVVVDELHALAENKRGAHLSVSLERLERLRDRSVSPLVRVGLSATVGEPATAAAFLVGAGQPCAVAAVTGQRRPELTVFSPGAGTSLRWHGFNGRPTRGGNPGGNRPAGARRPFDGGVREHARRARSVSGSPCAGRFRRWRTSIEIHHGSLDRSVRLEVEDRLKRRGASRRSLLDQPGDGGGHRSGRSGRVAVSAQERGPHPPAGGPGRAHRRRGQPGRAHGPGRGRAAGGRGDGPARARGPAGTPARARKPVGRAGSTRRRPRHG